MFRRYAIYIVILLLCGLALAACNGNSGATYEPEDDTPSDAARFVLEYEYFNDQLRDNGEPHHHMDIRPDNTVVYLDEPAFREFMQSGTGMFTFLNATCPWCRVAVPTMLDFAVDHGINLYYFNPVEDREADTQLHQLMLETWHEYLSPNDRDQTYGEPDFDPEWKRVSVPHVFFLQDGQVVSHIMLNRHEYVRDETLDMDALYALLTELYEAWRNAHNDTLFFDPGALDGMDVDDPCDLPC